MKTFKEILDNYNELGGGVETIDLLLDTLKALVEKEDGKSCNECIAYNDGDADPHATVRPKHEVQTIEQHKQIDENLWAEIVGTSQSSENNSIELPALRLILEKYNILKSEKDWM